MMGTPLSRTASNALPSFLIMMIALNAEKSTCATRAHKRRFRMTTLLVASN